MTSRIEICVTQKPFIIPLR